MTPLPGDSRENRDSATRIRGALVAGRYRVVSQIGSGAMATIHLAELCGPSGFRKWVALKRSHPHLRDDDDVIRMFVDEARLVARISHPNVAQVFELVEDFETLWIVMECLQGESLRDVVRRGAQVGRPLSRVAACGIVADAAEGLHAAHDLSGDDGKILGLVHRDVSPQNIVVTYGAEVKVVDFGVARWRTGATATRAGVLKGKLSYMSPEQASGEAVDRRTDVFALGVVLWELTTGHRLFRARNDLETLAAVQACEVPLPTRVVGGYPQALEEIVMKALAKDRASRYPTARELSRALARFAADAPDEDLERYMRAIFAERIAQRELFLRGAAAREHDDEPTLVCAPPEEEDTTLTRSVPPHQSERYERYAAPPVPAPPRTPTEPRLPPVVVWAAPPRAQDSTLRIAAWRATPRWMVVAAAVALGVVVLAIVVLAFASC